MLGRSGVIEVESVAINGDAVPFVVAQSGRRTLVHALGFAGQAAQITYTAGIDITNHAGVRAWMLLVVAWLYANRELMGQRKGAKAPAAHRGANSLIAAVDLSDLEPLFDDLGDAAEEAARPARPRRMPITFPARVGRSTFRQGLHAWRAARGAGGCAGFG